MTGLRKQLEASAAEFEQERKRQLEQQAALAQEQQQQLAEFVGAAAQQLQHGWRSSSGGWQSWHSGGSF